MATPPDREGAVEAAIERALQELAEEARESLSGHPGVEELVAYQEGRLDAAGADRMRAHLAACRDCAVEVLQLEGFDSESPADPALLPGGEETLREWESFRRRRGESKDEPEAAGAGTRRARAVPAPLADRRRLMVRFPLAASIVIALLGLAFWAAGVLRWQKSPDAPDGARGGAPFVFDLLPDDEDLRRAASPVQEVEVPPGMDTLVPRLLVGDQTPQASYRADLLNAEGERLGSRFGLPRHSEGFFALLLEPKTVPAGRYQVKLFGVSGGAETLLATYSFRLRYTEAE